MSKYRIVILSNKDCVHCQNALRVIRLFCEKNSKSIEYKVIDKLVYSQTNIYGHYEDFPVFLFIGKSGVPRKFDFVNDQKTERTYEKLKNVVSELSKMC
jgi:glutaredoxin